MTKKPKLKFSNKDFTIGGIASSLLAICALMLLVYGVYLSFYARGMAGAVVGGLGLLSFVLSIFGIIFGILSYKEMDKHYGFSFFGTFLNGIIIILLIFLILTAL